MKFTTPFLALSIALSACGDGSSTSESSTYVLYRNSVTDKDMRLHVATFDASEGEGYNHENCEQAKELFQAQSGVKTKFWCEKGRFKK